jgi:hypothetical protein
MNAIDERRIKCTVTVIGQSALRAQADLLNRIKLMLPVQSPSQKYFHSLLTQITSMSLASRPTRQGRFAIVTDVGLGCDGRGWRQRRERYLRTAKSCGPDAPTLASSWRERFRWRRWQTSPVTGESAK